MDCAQMSLFALMTWLALDYLLEIELSVMKDVMFAVKHTTVISIMNANPMANILPNFVLGARPIPALVRLKKHSYKLS